MKRRAFQAGIGATIIGLSGCSRLDTGSPTFRHQIVDHQLSEPVMNDELAKPETGFFRSGVFSGLEEVTLQGLHRMDREPLEEYDYSEHFLAVFSCAFRPPSNSVTSSIEDTTFVFSIEASNSYRKLSDEQYTIFEVWETSSNGNIPESSEVRVLGH